MTKTSPMPATTPSASARPPLSASVVITLAAVGSTLTVVAVAYLLITGFEQDSTSQATATSVVSAGPIDQLAGKTGKTERPDAALPSPTLPSPFAFLTMPPPTALTGQAHRSSSADPKAASPAYPTVGHSTTTVTVDKPTTQKPTKPSVAKTTKSATTKANATAKPKPATTTPPDWGTTVIHSTSVLHPGESWSTNRIRLSLLASGNAVLTDETGRQTWASNTSNPRAQLAFQGDGNLTLTDTANGTTLWSTRTDGHGSAILVLQADGNVAIEDGTGVLWAALR